MKLSEMSTEQFADAMLTLAPAVASIAEDKAITQVMDNIAKKSRGDALEFAGAIAREAVPALLKEHRADMYVILSAMSGKPAKEIQAQPVMQTIHDVRELLDADMIDFFKDAASAGPRGSR